MLFGDLVYIFQNQNYFEPYPVEITVKHITDLEPTIERLPDTSRDTHTINPLDE